MQDVKNIVAKGVLNADNGSIHHFVLLRPYFQPSKTNSMIITPLQHNHDSKGLYKKTLWEKEEIVLVNVIFSFSHLLSTLPITNLKSSVNSIFFLANAFDLDKFRILLLAKELPLFTKQQNYRLVQIECICRRKK